MAGRDPSSPGRIIAAVAAFAVVGTVLVVVLARESARFAGADRASVLVAIVGLVGVLFTAAVTLVGLLLKDSLDRRATLLQREAELRLKAETSLKAIETMTAKDLPPTLASERREGAIIALSSLSYHMLTLRLCERYWKEDGISTDLLMGVIDAALNSGEQHLATRAAELIETNAERLPESPEDFLFPHSYKFTWSEGIGFDVKNALLVALVKAMLAKPYAYWTSTAFNGFIYSLFKMFSIDRDRGFRMSAALCAVRLAQQLENDPNLLRSFLPPDRPLMSFGEVREAGLRTLGFDRTNVYPSDAELSAKAANIVAEDIYLLSIKIARWREPPAAPELPPAPG